MDQPQQTQPGLADPDEFVEFFHAGLRTKGVFQCVACGETAVVCDRLATCAACGERLWERADWTPFQTALKH